MANALTQLQETVATAVLETLAPGEEPVQIQTDKGSLQIQKLTAKSFANQTVDSKFGSVSMPADILLTDPNMVLDFSVSSLLIHQIQLYVKNKVNHFVSYVQSSSRQLED